MNRKLRVLCFIIRYPKFSETYMHEEMRSLYGDYDLRIITYSHSNFPRRNPLPYQVIEYQDTCPVDGPFEKVNRNFDNRKQRDFLEKVGAVIDEFKPDVMHAHYLGMALLLQVLSQRYQIPFTIRTHSMDMLSEPPEKIQAMCEAANNDRCLRVLCFPAFRDHLVNAGLLSNKVVGCWPVINYARFYKPVRREPTGRILCEGPALRKKAHSDFIDLAALMRGSGLAFDLYTKGNYLETTQAHNERVGNVVNITFADPDEMPDVYPKYDWLVYPSDTKINKVGFPIGIAEAQASGLGVCWQELPGRKEEQLEFLGGAGFLFKSIDELPEILTRPYPEEMRLRGLENASKCDIEKHKHLLTEAWEHALSGC